MKPEDNTEKTIEYYMDLPYTVELEFSWEKYEARIKELPWCRAEVNRSESVERLWQLLKSTQREWIEHELKMGREVPEPPGATRDPFWEDFEEHFPGFDGEDVRQMLHQWGVTCFPLENLEELWLRELEDVKMSEAMLSSEAPPKAHTHHGDQRIPWPKGDMRRVRLGQAGGKWAWIELNGPRTKRGYRDVEVLDKTLRAEAAIVAALTVLEASIIGDIEGKKQPDKVFDWVDDDDFDWLREALLEQVKADPELQGKKLQEVLDGLPSSWFLDVRAARDKRLVEELDKYLERFPPEKRDKERRKRLKKIPTWERNPYLWMRSIQYMLTLFRYRRPDFDDYTLREQIFFLDHHRKQVNKFLKAQKDHTAFLEYGTPSGIKNRVVERAQDQVKAAVLKDVENLHNLDIAQMLITEVPETHTDNSKISEIDDLIRDGRRLLNKVLRDEGGWKKRAKAMKAEAYRYSSLDEESKLIEREAEIWGRTVEEVRSSYQQTGTKPSGVLAMDFTEPRLRP